MGSTWYLIEICWEYCSCSGRHSVSSSNGNVSQVRKYSRPTFTVKSLRCITTRLSASTVKVKKLSVLPLRSPSTYDRKSILARSKERILEPIGIIHVCVVVDPANMGWGLKGPTPVCWKR